MPREGEQTNQAKTPVLCSLIRRLYVVFRYLSLLLWYWDSIPGPAPTYEKDKIAV